VVIVVFSFFVCFVLGAGAGFLGAEVVVGGLDMYIRCGSVRLC